MSKKALPVIIITVCLLFAGCKAPADQEQKNNTETAVLSTETQEEEWKQVHSTQKDLEKLPQKIQKIFSDNQTFFDVEKEKEYDKNSFIKTLTKEGYRPQWAEFLVADWDNDGEYELAVYIKNSPDYNDCRIFDASNKKVYAHAFTARAIEGISDMGIIRGSSGAADTDYDRLFLDGKEQKFYEYKGEKVYLSVEYAWSHDSIVSGM